MIEAVAWVDPHLYLMHEKERVGRGFSNLHMKFFFVIDFFITHQELEEGNGMQQRRGNGMQQRLAAIKTRAAREGIRQEKT